MIWPWPATIVARATTITERDFKKSIVRVGVDKYWEVAGFDDVL